ncbi:MAG: hypothetical protein IJJ04_03730 [Clostridia bacterium]|nr:hypothetical protein [Clostridia bacterium]
MDVNLKNEKTVLWGKKVIICTLSLILLGFCFVINIAARQGADPITVFYEGFGKFLNMNVGLAVGLLNFSLVAFVFYVNRKYINIGTVIYLFVLGNFINFGIWMYNLLHIPNVFICQLIMSLIGCLFCFIGLGGFMAVDIGIDPWTAAAVILSKKINKSFRSVKIVLDGLTLFLGWIMGGKVGVITVFCVFAGGPIIQKSNEILDKLIQKMLEFNHKD